MYIYIYISVEINNFRSLGFCIIILYYYKKNSTKTRFSHSILSFSFLLFSLPITFFFPVKKPESAPPSPHHAPPNLRPARRRPPCEQQRCVLSVARTRIDRIVERRSRSDSDEHPTSGWARFEAHT